MHKRLIAKLAALDIDRLQEVLDYDPESGMLSWRVRLSPHCKLGCDAGYITAQGYRAIVIDKMKMPAHHLAWFHFYGSPSESELDHRNLRKADNRIENLRPATRTQNAMNRPRASSNTSGFKGVAKFYNRYNRAKWRSQIRVNGKRIFLGLFHTPEEAYEVYRKKVAELHGEFARDK